MAVSVNAQIARIIASQRSAISLCLSGRAALPRRQNIRPNDGCDSPDIAALADGENEEERQLCPTELDTFRSRQTDHPAAHAIAGKQNHHKPGASACQRAME